MRHNARSETTNPADSCIPTLQSPLKLRYVTKRSFFQPLKLRRNRQNQNGASSSSLRPPRCGANCHSHATSNTSTASATTTNLPWPKEEVQAIWHMARPINLIPSMLLVIHGASSTVGIPTALASSRVWLMATISSAIAAASCLINDYFDTDIDAINHAPLLTATVPPEHLVLVSLAVYILVLLAACAIPDTITRLLVAASAATTLLYTPLLKRHLSVLKNVSVAAVIAAAPICGALAAGAAHPATTLLLLLRPSAFLFLSIWYRELLMDVADVDGDAVAGINTLPVVLGRAPALGLGMLMLVGCLGLIVWAAMCGGGGEVGGRMGRWVVGGGGSAVVVGRPMVTAVQLWKGGFVKEDVQRAIDETLKTVGVGMIVLAVLG